MANTRRRMFGLAPKKSKLSMTAKKKYLETRAFLRAWKPQNKQVYEKVITNAGKYAMNRANAAEAKGMNYPELGELQLHEMNQFIKRFALNRALDAVGVSYHSESGMEFRRQVIKDFLGPWKLSKGATWRLYKRLGKTRTNSFLARLEYFKKNLGKAQTDTYEKISRTTNL